MSNIDYLGPLKYLVGNWSGSGFDTSKSGGTVPYFHELILEPIPRLSYSSEHQVLNSLRFVSKMWASEEAAKLNNFFPVYEENGYISWVPDKANASVGSIVKQVSNPRGVSFMAIADSISENATNVALSCTRDQVPDGGIIQAPQLTEIYYPVVGYTSQWDVNNNELKVSDATILEIAENEYFHQTDESVLTRY